MELTKIHGISDKRAKDLADMGILDTGDLIRCFPRGYLDMRSVSPLKYAYNNDIVLTAGVIVSTPLVRYYRRGGMVKISCEQEGFFFSVVWFNQPYVASRLKVGEEYLFYGRVKYDDFGATLYNPSFEQCDKAYRLKGIVPQYKIKGGLTQKVMRDAIRLAVDIEKPKSVIPQSLIKKYELDDLYSAYKEVHNPQSFESEKKAADRIAVEEYFSLISAFKFIKGGRGQVRINRYDCTEREILKFVTERFHFEFTEGQKKAVSEIYADMTGASVMNRLMQGDVGSGKTAVSMCAIFVAVKSGYQVAFLAPTEVLAKQNYEATKKAFPDYNIALITGSNTAKEKKEIKDDLKNGLTNIIVGTHALLTSDVEFKRLSLCICDEQQRFGVAQRSELLNKGITPDVLVMSATPIPRTLSLIFYGDLDISTIADKPKMRIPVQTNVVPAEKYNAMLGFIKKEAEAGKQTYFVCPKIEGDEEGEIMSATDLYNEIKQKLDPLPVGLLHGKMKDKEKNAVMQDFKDKKFSVLVSTTVIEVGVDVPSATVMVIYNAERFGLSQIHQLRGRVGRSDIKSYCFLLSNAKTPEATERLKIVTENADGFKISEYDYKMRGSGDFMGDRQSGKFMNDLGSLNYDSQAIFLAKKISDETFERGENLDSIKEVAIKKYQRLKDISMN